MSRRKVRRHLAGGAFLASALLIPGPVRTADLPEGREGIESLIVRLGDDDAQVREKAFRKLSGRAEDFPDAVLGLLPAEPADPEVRERCSRIGRIAAREQAKRQALAAVGEDPGRRAAVEQMFVARKGRALKAVIWNDAGVSEGEVDTRLLAGSLVRFVQIEVLEGSRCPARLEAVACLGPLGGRSVAPLIGELLECADNEVRIQVIRVLGDLGAAESLPGLLAATEDAHPDVRGMAAAALGRLGDRSAASRLRVLAAEDPVPLVRDRALEALKKLGEPPPPLFEVHRSKGKERQE